jgi:hypothetical protein
MTFYAYDSTGIDTPPALESLRGLSGAGAFGVAPILIAGAAGVAAAGTLVADWLASDAWSVGEYNDYMKAMDSLIHQLDKLGWANGCWQNNPVKYQQWRDFAWGRFSVHYGEYGKQSVYLPDSAEKPARNLLRELAAWVQWFEKTCGDALGPNISEPRRGDPSVDPSAGVAAQQWGDLVKWGALGLGALVLLNIVQGVRGALPRE